MFKKENECQSAKLYQVFEDEQFVHLVMDYCGHETLSQVLATNPAHLNTELKIKQLIKKLLLGV
jgi:serine/threonine protein kinase